ncbi:hypothetical protein RND81_01G052500 [Saponaria officinalis]|uniref:Uncharacterized protein n=1 Tax=Saponaria officinalis TaxID=3572 RepID=A0AAW1N8S6_SAPOF
MCLHATINKTVQLDIGFVDKFYVLYFSVLLTNYVEIKYLIRFSVYELFLTIQRNVVAFHSWYTDAVSKIKHLSTDVTVQDGFVPSQSTQDFLQFEELHRFCDRVESDAERLKQSASNTPVPQEVHFGTENVNSVDDVATQQLRDVLDDLKTTRSPVAVNDEGVEQVASDTVRSRSGPEPTENYRMPPTPRGNESEEVKRGSEDVRSHNFDTLSDEINGSGAVYNTAEINEVLQREGKVISCADGANNNTTDALDRAILEDAGYTTAEVDASFQLMEQGNGTCTEVGAADLGQQEVGLTAVGGDSVEDLGLTPQSESVQQANINQHSFDLPPAVPLTWTGEGTCKRRRTSMANRVTNDAVVVSEQPAEELSAVSSRRRGKGDGLGCSIDCGQTTGASLLVVSNFLRNMALFRNVKD